MRYARQFERLSVRKQNLDEEPDNLKDSSRQFEQNLEVEYIAGMWK